MPRRKYNAVKIEVGIDVLTHRNVAEIAEANHLSVAAVVRMAIYYLLQNQSDYAQDLVEQVPWREARDDFPQLRKAVITWPPSSPE